jgi:CubicO group peptidase (beta-lactamase class C family)
MTLHRRMFLKQLGLSTAGLSVASLRVGLLAAAAPGYQHLPRSAPEAQGVASSGISEFLEAIPTAKLELHSFMMVRHGHVVSECWWAPYRHDATHWLYSLSKSFTSTAVGFAVTEGKLKLDDRVVDFFPDQLPAIVSDNLAALRIKHLLTMSVGHKTDSTATVVGNPAQSDWVKTFLSLPIENPPGSVFLYDSGGSFMLSAIVQKVTGQKVVEYLEPRLFAPLQIQQKSWESSPLGINCGGWGLSVVTETLAKFGQLYLQRGLWNGRQLLPSQWVDEATTFKIQQPVSWNSGSEPAAQADRTASLADPGAALSKLRQTSDWYQGYAYQFWRCRHNAFRGDGAFGQFCLVLPDEDAVVAITSETGNLQGVLNLVWDHLLPAMHDAPVKREIAADARLKQTLRTRTLPLPPGEAKSALADSTSGRTFMLEPNSLGIESVRLQFADDSCLFALKNATGVFEVRCGLGKWLDGTTQMPGEPPALLPNSEKNAKPIKVAAAAAWRENGTFEMQWRFYETPHRDTVVCKFHGDGVDIQFLNSITAALGSNQLLHPELRPPLKGHAVS